MKDDEVKFFRTIVKYGRCEFNGKIDGSYLSVREIMNILGEFINYKRCWYILQKWCGAGFYDYGTTLDLGWIYLNRLPDRYRVLIEDLILEKGGLK